MNNLPHIRCAEEKDVEGILAIYAPYVAETPVSFETEVPTPGEMWDRISSILSGLPYLACQANGQIAGYAYASNFRQRKAYQWSKEVSVYVAPGFRGKHVATGLYLSLFEILRIQGVTNLLAGITVPNKASTIFHESAGFRKCGEYTAVGYKHGLWHNVGWWELSLNPDLLPPKQLIPFSKIYGSDVVKNAFSIGEAKIIL